MTRSLESADEPIGKVPRIPELLSSRAGSALACSESIGLSDLAVSPFGMPTSLLSGEVRVAWLGRTSTHERQDPRQSLIRQLERCRGAVPAAWVIVCHFYDVESGRMELDQRGHGIGYDRFDIPIVRFTPNGGQGCKKFRQLLGVTSRSRWDCASRAWSAAAYCCRNGSNCQLRQRVPSS